MHTEHINMFWKNIQCNAYLNKYTVFSVNKENKLNILDVVNETSEFEVLFQILYKIELNKGKVIMTKV